MRSRNKQKGFTIVELLIVIVVIAILAAISIVAYRGVQQRAARSVVSADLRNAATSFEMYKADNGSYPASSLPPGIKTSKGVVLSATNTAGDAFCVNAYYQSDPSLQLSWDSKKGLQNDTLCSGAAIGGASGGDVPLAARGTNLMPGFSQWTLSGSAAYNSSTGELTLGANGSAKSPLVRVDHPATLKAGGDMYATIQSANASVAPQGGYHVSILYYDTDGTTAAQNTAGYTGNGCAKGFALNSWQLALQNCVFYGGPNVIYAAYSFQGPNAGYTSSDIKIKTPFYS